MKALERLEDRKLVKKLPRGMGEPYLWMLKDQFVPRGNFKHLNSCAELFVSLFPHFTDWQWEVQKKFRPDREAVINGKKVYLEVDRGTEKASQLLDKLDRYVNYWKETQEEFHVVFTVEDYQDPFGKIRTSASARGGLILDLFNERKLPGNFHVAVHTQLASNPASMVVSRFAKTSFLGL